MERWNIDVVRAERSTGCFLFSQSALRGREGVFVDFHLRLFAGKQEHLNDIETELNGGQI